MLETQRFSLRGRLLSRLLVPMLLLFAISGMASYLLATHFANSVYDDWLYDSVNSMALGVQYTEKGIGLDFPASAQRLFEWDDADVIYYKISGDSSGYITGRADLPLGGRNTRQHRAATLFESALGGEEVHIAMLELPASHYGERVFVQVAETGQKRSRLTREILLGTLLPQILLIAVAIAVIGSSIRSALAPLQSLATQLSERDHRGLRPIDEVGVPTEVQPLTQALNALLARLDTALVAQRKFIADAAHQLRTPLTALKLHLDQAQREIREPVEPVALPALRRTLTQLRSSSDRAVRLSNQLLSLARSEPEAQQSHVPESIDLHALALETGAEWVPRALQKNIELSLEGASSSPVQGNAALIREALNNLLDNAVKYHPGNGHIVLTVSAAPATISVDDDGPGIPPEQRAQAFQRFHRGDRNSGEGSGLGLAIVQEIMAIHGGRAELSDGLSGRGLNVTLVFAPPK